MKLINQTYILYIKVDSYTELADSSTLMSDNTKLIKQKIIIPLNIMRE